MTFETVFAYCVLFSLPTWLVVEEILLRSMTETNAGARHQRACGAARGDQVRTPTFPAVLCWPGRRLDETANAWRSLKESRTH